MNIQMCFLIFKKEFRHLQLFILPMYRLYSRLLVKQSPAQERKEKKKSFHETTAFSVGKWSIRMTKAHADNGYEVLSNRALYTERVMVQH